MNKFYKLPTVVLRIFTTYGPGMRPQTAIPLFIDRLSKNLPIDFYHDIDATRDFIYIDDVINSIIATFNKRINFQIINIASGNSYTFVDIAQKIAKLLNKSDSNIKVVSHEKDFRNLIVKYTQADITRAKKILKFTPQVTLDEGLKETVDWYMKNPDILYMSTHH